MPTPEELLGAKTPLGASIDAGVVTLALDQKIEFTAYTRKVLPFDGYVFWIRTDILEPSARFNTFRYAGGVPFGQRGAAAQPLNVEGKPFQTTLTARCSVHIATELRQDEAADFAQNRIIFTSLQPIQELNDIAPDVLYIAEFEGTRFAFSQRGSFYKQSSAWHYVGYAVYSTMESQLIEDTRGFNRRALIVSNSLPAWLALNHYAPAWPVPVPFPPVALYPSFLVPQNLPPPYVAVHIDGSQTVSIQAGAQFGPTLSETSLATDRVTLTLYGCANDVAISMVSAILQYAYDNGSAAFGVMNSPAVRDEKETQAELGTIAQKKRIVFDVNYYQGAMRNVARQLITQVVPSFTFGVPGDPHQLITTTG